MDFSEKDAVFQQDMVFYTRIKERRDRMMLMLLLFIMPSSNTSLRKELLEYIETLFDPQVEEKNAEIIRAKEKKMMEMMGKAFVVVGNNKDGSINVNIEDEKHENTPKHRENIGKNSKKHSLRVEKPKKPY